MIIDENTYLEHFGVKGMKWGIRNEPGSNGRKKYISATPKPNLSKKQRAANVAKNNQAFLNKTKSSEGDSLKK